MHHGRLAAKQADLRTMPRADSHSKEASLQAAPRGGFFHAVARALKRYRLGDLLVMSGTINSAQLEAALAEQKKTGEQLGKILIRHGALSAIQLYRKLAEQWCLRASAAGLAIIMQAVTPSPASANDNITLQFTLAAATTQAVHKTLRYPGLFDTREIKHNDVSAFKKWTDVMQRFDRQMQTTAAYSPRIIWWKASIMQLKDKSPREQIEGVNSFFNSLPYIEDARNYGKSDYWATPVELLNRGGDCEDFAIAKYASLRALGFSSQQLRIAIVQDLNKNVPHAVLV